MFKKIISIVLVFAMLSTMLPVNFLFATTKDSGDIKEEKYVIENEYLKLTVQNQGPSRGEYSLETTGGNSSVSTDDNQLLLDDNLAGYESSNQEIFIDVESENMIFMPDEDKDFIVNYEEQSISCIMTYDGLEITRVLQLVGKEDPQEKNLLKISYEIKNVSDRERFIGADMILDLAQGNDKGPRVNSIKDRSPYSISHKALNEAKYVSSAEIISWGAENDLGFSSIGYLDTFGENYSEIQIADVDRFNQGYEAHVLYNWNKENYSNYKMYRYYYQMGALRSFRNRDFEPLGDNSMLVISWEERTLAKGQSLVIGTLYGVKIDQTLSFEAGNYKLSVEDKQYLMKMDSLFSRDKLVIDNKAKWVEYNEKYYDYKQNIMRTSTKFDDIVFSKKVSVSLDNPNELIVELAVENKGTTAHNLEVTTSLIGRDIFLPGVGIVKKSKVFSKVPEILEYKFNRANYIVKLLETNDIYESITNADIGGYDRNLRGYSSSFNWLNQKIKPGEKKQYRYSIEKQGAIAKDVSVYDFSISIKDKYDRPIKNVLVKSRSKSALTDENGCVSFQAQADKETFTLSKKYYETKEVLGTNPGKTVHIVLKDSTDKPVVEEVNYKDIEGNSINLLNKRSSIYLYDKKIDQVELSIVGNFKSSKAKAYRLYQGTKLIKESNQPNFTIDIEEFKAKEALSIEIVDKKGFKSIKESIGLMIHNTKPFVYGYPDLPGADMFFGRGLDEIKIKKNVPIIGGEKINVGLKDLTSMPGFITVNEDGSVEVAIGGNVKVKEDLASFKKEFDKSYMKSHLIKDSSKIPYAMGEGNVSASIMGYGKGYIKDDVMYVDMTLLLGIKGSYEVTYSYVASAVPFYFDGGIEVAGSTGGTFSITYDEIRGWEVDGIQARPLSVSAKAYIGAAVGIKNVLSAGGHAYIMLLYSLDFSDWNSSLDATGGLEVYAHLLFKKVKKNIYKKTWHLYDQGKDEVALAVEELNKDLYSQLYEEDNYNLIRPNQYVGLKQYFASNDMTSILPFSSKAFGGHSLNTLNIYEGSKPLYIKDGSKEYVFYMTPDGSRNLADSSKLVYSVNEVGKSLVWSPPIAIKDDGTGDFNMDVSLDPSTHMIHIVWQNMTKTFADDASFEEVTQNVEIAHCILSTTDNKVTVDTVTKNDMYPLMANVGTNNGNVLIAWVENDANDIFAEQGSNTLYTYSKDDTANPIVTTGSATSFKKLETSSETTVTTGAATKVGLVNGISSMDVGILDGSLHVAYELDEDGINSTIEDREIYLLDKTISVKITEDNVLDCNPKFKCVNGVDSLIWYRNQNICTINKVGDSLKLLLEDDKIATDEIHVVEGGKGDKIIWSSPSQEEKYKSQIMAIDKKSDGRWTRPYILHKDVDVLQLSSAYINALNEVEIVGIRTNSESNFWGPFYKTLSIPSEIKIEKITFDDDAVIPGKPLDMDIDISNLGGLDISTYTIEVLYDDASIMNETINQSIKNEETYTKHIALDIPHDVSSMKNFKVIASTPGEAEYSKADNEKEFKMGYTDIVLSSESIFRNGNDYASLTIMNASPFETDARLEIRKDSAHGDIVDQYELKGINETAFSNMLINMTTLANQNDTHVFYAALVAQDNEIYTFNNNVIITVPNALASSTSDINDNGTTVVNSSNKSKRHKDKPRDNSNRTLVELKANSSKIIKIQEGKKVDGNVFKTLKETENAKLIFEGDGYELVFDSNNELKTSDRLINLNLAIDLEKDNFYHVKFEEAKALPMACKITFDTDEKLNGRQVYLCLEDENGHLSVLAERQRVMEDGKTTFFIDQAGDYTLLEKLPLDKSVFKDDVAKIPYVKGYSDKTFRPNAEISKVEMLSLLNSLLKNTDHKADSVLVNENIWAKDAIENVYEYGFVDLDEDGYFGVNTPITRGELSKIIINILDPKVVYIGGSTSFVDLENHKLKPYMEECYQLGIFKGDEGLMRPDGYLTRAEAVTVMNRLLSREYRTEEIINNDFSDLTRGHWAYREILNASQGSLVQ